MISVPRIVVDGAGPGGRAGGGRLVGAADGAWGVGFEAGVGIWFNRTDWLVTKTSALSLLTLFDVVGRLLEYAADVADEAPLATTGDNALSVEGLLSLA